MAIQVYGDLACKSSHKVRIYSIELPHVEALCTFAASVASIFAQTRTCDKESIVFFFKSYIPVPFEALNICLRGYQFDYIRQFIAGQNPTLITPEFS